ncbi:MAG: alpha-E domain-containing protein [Firmicutes bacterium]|nr:alpha-E domain-containing protein [Bacillota bacterium]
MGIISIENSDRLFWLGRYSERVYTSTRLFATSFDRMIDGDIRDYDAFCSQLDIPNIYLSKEDFCRRYITDEEDPNSIYSNLIRAYDNAIVLRNEIGSEPISYIQLAVYDMKKCASSNSPVVELQRVTDHILAFWGIVDDMIECENFRNIIKTGKRIERLDLFGRLQMDRVSLVREVNRLSGRITKTNLRYDQGSLDEIKRLVKEEKTDYDRIVELVDHLLKD